MMSSKTRRLVGITGALLLAFTLTGLACIASPSISSTRAASGPAVVFVGTWTGQGIQDNNPFDITLTVGSSQVNGNSFSGIVTEDGNTVNVTGVFNSHRRTFVLLFISNKSTATTGSFIPVIYSGYVSSGTALKGVWFVPPTPPSSSQALVGQQGTISLTKQ